MNLPNKLTVARILLVPFFVAALLIDFPLNNLAALALFGAASITDLLDGKNSVASQFGEIFYYEDDDIVKWGKDLQIERTYGVRAFWDLQQNQEIQTDEEWQNKMTELELRVSTMPEFRQIAFFHHIILKKQ